MNFTRGVGRAGLGGKQLKIPPGVGLGGGVKDTILERMGGGGGPGNLETPLATPLSTLGLIA